MCVHVCVREKGIYAICVPLTLEARRGHWVCCSLCCIGLSLQEWMHWVSQLGSSTRAASVFNSSAIIFLPSGFFPPKKIVFPFSLRHSYMFTMCFYPVHPPYSSSRTPLHMLYSKHLFFFFFNNPLSPIRTAICSWVGPNPKEKLLAFL